MGLLLVGHLRLLSSVLSSGFCFVLVAASSPVATSSCWVDLLPGKFSCLPLASLLPLNIVCIWFAVVG